MSARDSSLTLENDMGGMGHRLAHFGGSEPPPYEGIACASRCSPLCVILSGATRSRTLRLAQGVPTARDLARHKYGKARANASHLRILYCRGLPPFPSSPRIWSKCALIAIRFIFPYPWGIASRKRTMCLFACSPPGRGQYKPTSATLTSPPNSRVKLCLDREEKGGALRAPLRDGGNKGGARGSRGYEDAKPHHRGHATRASLV